MSGESRLNLDDTATNKSIMQATEKNLLDNVSLMTTFSPNPSLQQGGDGTEEFQKGKKIIGHITDKLTTGTSSQNMEVQGTANLSTLAAVEERLEHLDGSGNSTGKSRSPSPHNLSDQRSSGNEKIMYGFDLSPVHSIEKGTSHMTVHRSDLDHPNKILMNEKEPNIQVNDSQYANPNFKRAKQTGSVELDLTKSAVNEDTETVMSQVFSSQDAGVPSVENQFAVSLTLDERNLENLEYPRKKKLRKNSKIASVKKSISSHSSVLRRPTVVTRKQEFSTKTTPTKHAKGSLANEVTPPKSPQSRRTIVKLMPKAKRNANLNSRESVLRPSSSPRPKHSSIHPENALQTEKSDSDSTLRSETDISPQTGPHDTVGALHHLNGKSNNDVTGSFVLVLQELNDMRFHFFGLEQQYVVILKERDQLSEDNKTLHEEKENLKKDNFIMRSKLAQVTSRQINKKNTTEPCLDTTDDDDVIKLKQEMAGQENLIKGYQKENERIYEELKKAKKASKEMEQAMYEENSKLTSEVAKLQEFSEMHAKSGQGNRPNDTEIIHESKNLTGDNDISYFQNQVSILANQLRVEEGLRSKAESLVQKLTNSRDEAERKCIIYKKETEQIRANIIAEHKIELENLHSKHATAKSLIKNNVPIGNISSPHSRSALSHFQKRIEKLEWDLKNHDKSASRAVTSVEQQYSDVKAKYEERICDLKKQVTDCRETSKENSTKLMKLEENKLILQGELAKASRTLEEESENWKHERDTLFAKISELQQQAALQRKVTKKGSERHARLSTEHTNYPKFQQKYDPVSFEEGYTSLSQQNTALKRTLDSLKLEFRHFQVTKEALLAKLQQEVKTQRDVYDRKLAELKQQSDKVSTDNENFLTDKVLQLQQALDEKCERITRLKITLQQVTASKAHEQQAFQMQVHQLVSKLREASSSSLSASARKMKSLEDKLHLIQEEFRIKEHMLKKVSFEDSSSLLRMEYDNIRDEMEKKNKEIARFRLELDSILLVLRELHSQGVKIPLPQCLQSMF